MIEEKPPSKPQVDPLVLSMLRYRILINNASMLPSGTRKMVLENKGHSADQMLGELEREVQTDPRAAEYLMPPVKKLLEARRRERVTATQQSQES